MGDAKSILGEPQQTQKGNSLALSELSREKKVEWCMVVT
jgi:hypothetical protein